MMKRIVSTLFLLLFDAIASHAQTAAVSGHMVFPTAGAPTNAKVCVTLSNYKPNVPRVIGTGVIVQQTNYCVTPAADGSYSFTLVRNDSINPSGSYWRFDFMWNGQQQSSANYLVNSSPFNIDTASPLSTIPVLGPNQLVLQTYPCVVSVANTTWTCTHNFNDQMVLVSVFDTTSHRIFPDTEDDSNPNVTTLTFVSAQAGTALISHAGAITIATSQPNAVLQNPAAGQVVSQSLQLNGPVTLAGLTTCKTFENVRCIDPSNSAGWAGSDVGAWVNAALADTPSGGTVRIAPGSYTLSTQMVLSSNTTVECSPNTTTLTAGVSVNTPMILASGINHFRFAGCTIDGNRSGNSNQFALMQLSNSSHGEVVGNHFQNNQSRAVWVAIGNSNILIRDNEINNYGQALPASLGNEGIVIAPGGSGAGNSHIEVSHNRVHDGNLGIVVLSSSNTANTTVDLNISYNRVYSQANDAILTFSSGTVAKMQGIRIENNETYCNGWPAGGTGFSTSCTAGLLQTGVTASTSGVGIDLNSPQLDQPLIIGNRSHDNFFEGIDAVAQSFTTVNCTAVANSVCTATAGDPFDTSWQAGQVVSVSGTDRAILSVASTTQLTLNTNVGALTGVQLAAPNWVRGTFIGNTAYANGQGNTGTSGSGFADSAIGNTWIGNIAYNNQAYGFIDQWSSSVTHTGDKAYNNSQRGVGGGAVGFISQDALNASYINITAFDSQVSPTQAGDINLTSLSTNNYVDSPSILSSRITNNGTLNSFRLGKFFTGDAPCLATTGSSGSYCLQGSAAGGAYLATLPAVNGTLSPLIAKDCGTTTTCSATDISSTVRIFKGSVALASGTPSTATVTGISPAFSSTSSFVCTATNATTQANPVKIVNASSSSITITGPNTVTDTINYSCVGN